MSKKKIAVIIAGCIVAIIVIVAIVTHTSTHKYTFSVSVSPSGTGSVSPSSGEYESGVQIIVTASPASGYTFGYWSGSSSGTTPTVTIIMDSDKSLIANFKAIPQTYTLTTNISPSGAGSVSPSGGEYEAGVQATVTASPASGYTFDHWSGDASGTSATIVITMDSDKDIIAYFEEEPPPITQKITITYSSMTTTQIGTGYFPDKPDPGNVFLVLDMTIKNQGYDSFSTNQFYFSVIVDSVKYGTAFVTELNNELELVDVLDGGTVRGKLAFEVPKKVTTLGFEPVYDDSWNYYNIEWVRK